MLAALDLRQTGRIQLLQDDFRLQSEDPTAEHVDEKQMALVTIKLKNRDYVLKAENLDEARAWVVVLEEIQGVECGYDIEAASPYQLANGACEEAHYTDINVRVSHFILSQLLNTSFSS